MKIYVVIGDTGEHSDRTEWLTQAFKTEEAAKDKILQLSVLLQKQPQTHKLDYDSRKETIKLMKEFDPNFELEYGGTSWRVEEVELID